MQWIALRWPLETHPASAPAPPMPSLEALGWWALQFTPRVAWVDEGLLLEVSACERLWGGRQSLMREMARLNPAEPVRLQQAQGATSLVALARLRLFARGQRSGADLPGSLPLDTLSAARDHLDVLARMGCRTWGDLDALPRGGLVRRFGAGLRNALDVAWGRVPEQHAWLTLPDVFDQKIELPALAENASELMWSANRLLTSLQIWLRARQRGALALELQWTLDLKRYNGVNLPPHEQIAVRTAEPTQDMAHLRRLLTERLALTRLAAPASWLRLRSLDTTPWAGASTSFLPEDNRKGDKLHELVERLGARLGADQVVMPVAQADHRPEHMQAWQPAMKRIRATKGKVRAGRAGETVAAPARVPASASASASESPSPSTAPAPAPAMPPGSLYPPWLLHKPLPLEVRNGHPHYQGRLSKLIGPQRLETGWWDDGHLAVRDYFIAESPGAGLVWIFRERPTAWLAEDTPRWFLQGLYA
ncbi:DNA polymerase Y family protein [Variovorax sp. J22R133]|uniref:Y-family DNA polymerase n=1 Tax=Variovorax brevis TaxID=3053503 RepID=UPI002576476E|nr:DNA polymerase Y family protein [Variovorax sp. J22R133]MDM0112762.1 DNA polymerase Y family protein [Variovorax sp. J22R133]